MPVALSCFSILRAEEVGQFRHGIDLVGRRLLFGDALQVLQECPRVALQGIGQVIDPQKLHRPRRRLRPVPRGQLQFIAQRIAGNAAERDPLRRHAAGEGRGCQQDDHSQAETSAAKTLTTSRTGRRVGMAWCFFGERLHFGSLQREPGLPLLRRSRCRKSPKDTQGKRRRSMGIWQPGKTK